MVMLEYAIVPESAIDPSYGRAVGQVIATAARDLGLARLGVRFVVEADKAPRSWERVRVLDDDAVPAWTSPERPGVIYLHLMWDGAVVQTLLHEARHAWQYDRDPTQTDPAAFAAAYDDNESDAEQYAAAGMSRLELRELPEGMRRIRRRD